MRASAEREESTVFHNLRHKPIKSMLQGTFQLGVENGDGIELQ